MSVSYVHMKNSIQKEKHKKKVMAMKTTAERKYNFIKCEAVIRRTEKMKGVLFGSSVFESQTAKLLKQKESLQKKKK